MFASRERDQRLSALVQHQPLRRDELPKYENLRDAAATAEFRAMLEKEIKRMDDARTEFAKAIDELQSSLRSALATAGK
jgi:hypothetical protein